MTCVAWARGLLPKYQPTIADLLALDSGYV